MDVREKLVELLMQARIGWTKEELVDYLIANGVTVQEWIPVEDMLPQKYGAVCKNVILRMDDELATVGWLNQVTGKGYYLDAINDFVFHAPLSRFTHWMPLPQPPKGD